MKRACLGAVALIALLLAPAGARLGGGQSYSSGRSSSSSSSSSRSYSSSSSSSYRPSSSSSSYRPSSSSSSSRPSTTSSSSSVNRPSSAGTNPVSSGPHTSSASSGQSNTGVAPSVSTPAKPISPTALIFLFLLFGTIFIVPPIVIVLIMAKLVSSARPQTVQGAPQAAEADFPKPVASRALARVKAVDPNFSEPAFKAFANLLFARLHNARGKGFSSLRAYFDRAVLSGLELEDPASDVVVGATRFLVESDTSAVPKGWQSLDVEFEATYSGPGPDSFTIERWTLGRHTGTLSKDPEALLNLGCPSCGNSGELSAQGVCPFCNQTVDNGAFNWKVMRRQVVQLVPKPPIVLELGGEEVGTDLPTIFQPDIESHRRAFTARYPEFEMSDFKERASSIFLKLQEAWSTLDFDKARPFETDPLYDTHRFWIERYRQQGLTNHLENIQIRKMEPCRYDHDAFYDIITVRIFASMIDYTTDQRGVPVSGNGQKPRIFSEYWTFLRRIGAKAGPVKTDLSGCPNCGAPLRISQTGVCEYCQAKVTSGEFDWILSSIDQDESYVV